MTVRRLQIAQYSYCLTPHFLGISFNFCIYFVHFQEYFDFIEREQKKDFEFILRTFQAIAPLLTKVEGLVVNTNTGESPKLKQYYAHWELKIFNSLTTVSGLNEPRNIDC